MKDYICDLLMSSGLKTLTSYNIRVKYLECNCSLLNSRTIIGGKLKLATTTLLNVATKYCYLQQKTAICTSRCTLLHYLNLNIFLSLTISLHATIYLNFYCIIYLTLMILLYTHFVFGFNKHTLFPRIIAIIF